MILTDGDHFACSVQQKLCLFNKLPCIYIAMLTWCRCAPPILFWPGPPYDLLPRSCLTCILFIDPHWWVPWYNLDFLQQSSMRGTTLHAAPNKLMPFRQIIMYILQCPHDRHVHLFSFDLHQFNLFLLRFTCSNMPHLELRTRDIPGTTGACLFS